MFVELDFRSHVPIYVQIVDRVKHLLATGALQPGDQLPTVRQLAADLRVNFNTVARAYRILDEAGVISTQQGRGTFVLEAPPPENARHLRRAALEALTRSFLHDANRLGFDPGDVAQAVESFIERWRQSGVPPEDGQ
ncbi:MAG: GntR family transcriptional regulator [Anaerolineales bacterium]|nr:GntR family transcriptional regulator [Anaerolineales bacterium]